MKKLVWAAVFAAAVFAVSDADARSRERRSTKPDDVELHGYYKDGAVQDIRHDLLLTANLWKIKNRSQKQVWNTVEDGGRNVAAKIKGNDYKDFVKVKADGERAFVKDVSPVGRAKHVAKIREHGRRHVVRDVAFQNGEDVISGR